MLIQTVERLPGVLTRFIRTPAALRFAYGLYQPIVRHLPKDQRRKYQNILAILGTPEGRLLIPAHNIVTDEGDKYYAQRGAAETPTQAFTTFVMASARATAWDKADVFSNITAIAGSTQVTDATYPKTNDGDADNTGAGVDKVTWRVSYTAASFSGIIVAGVITIASPIAGSFLLTGFDFTSFTKTTSDTLKVFVNHEMLGV